MDEIDYDVKSFNAAPPIAFENSCLLTQGSNSIVAAAIRKALEQSASAGGSGITQPGKLLQFFPAFAQKAVETFQQIAVRTTTAPGVPAVNRLPLEDIASALSDMDVLTGGLDGFIALLRGGFASDGADQPAEGDPAQGGPPTPFFRCALVFFASRSCG